MIKTKFILLVFIVFSSAATVVCADNFQNDQTDILLSINIHNLKDLYEFSFNMKTNKINKTYEAKVDKVEKGERPQYIVWSTGFGEKYMIKTQRRKDVLKKYRHIFPMDDVSLVEISNDGKYIAYTPKRNNQIIYIASLPDNKFQRTISPSKGSYITDLEWTNDSIGIITMNSRMGLGPLELLSASAGHTITHNSFYVETYSMKSGQHKVSTILENIIDGKGLLIR